MVGILEEGSDTGPPAAESLTKEGNSRIQADGREKQEESHQPPDGGLEAWLTVLAGFFIYFNTW